MSSEDVVSVILSGCDQGQVESIMLLAKQRLQALKLEADPNAKPLTKAEEACNLLTDCDSETLGEVSKFIESRKEKDEKDKKAKIMREKIVNLGKVWAKMINDQMKNSLSRSYVWKIEDQMSIDIRDAIVQHYRDNGYKVSAYSATAYTRAYVLIELIVPADVFIEGMKKACPRNDNDGVIACPTIQLW